MTCDVFHTLFFLLNDVPNESSRNRVHSCDDDGDGDSDDDGEEEEDYVASHQQSAHPV